MKKILSFACIAALLIGCGQKKTEESTEDSTGYEEIPTATEEVTETQEVAEVADGVYFLFPEDGATVVSPLKVGFGVSGMEVEPAGEVKEGMGHHHLVIDGTYVEEGTIVPADETHIHYGKGQLETEIELSPGKHTLTMQFADGVHKSFGEAWSKTIEITVEESEEPAAE